MSKALDDYDGPERRVCAHHSGVDTRLTIFNWLLGLLIAAILGSTVTIAAMLQTVNAAMTEINVKFATLQSDKVVNESIHRRIDDRLADLERREKERRQQ